MNMKNRQRLFWSVILLLNVGTWLTSCVCPKQRSTGLPMIKCEPVDVTVQPGQKAVFEVDARGKNLLYQWYFNDKPMGSEKGGRERVLVIPSARESDMGSYYAEIESTDLYGGPIGVRTRS